MRIIAGKYKGRRLIAPKGLDVRPTTDRVKEAVFSILGSRIDGAVVLDMFAGTGNLGLEALSRGAERAVFVDRAPKALAAIRKNVALLGLEDHSRILKIDLAKGPGILKKHAPFDLIFLDPPYGRGWAVKALAILGRGGIASAGALAVVENSTEQPPPAEDRFWLPDREQLYGQTRITFLLRA